MIDSAFKTQLKKYFSHADSNSNCYKEDTPRIVMSSDRRYCYWWRGGGKLVVISCDELDIIKQFSDLVDPSHTLMKFRINPHKENLFFLTNYKKEYTVTKYDTTAGSIIFKE